MGKARRYGRALFFGLKEKHWKLLDSRHRNVSPVISSEESLVIQGQYRAVHRLTVWIYLALQI